MSEVTPTYANVFVGWISPIPQVPSSPSLGYPEETRLQVPSSPF